MSDIAIRPTREDEYDAVTQVWLDSHVSTGLAVAGEASFAELRARIPHEIANGWQLYVAEQDGVIVAMLAFRTRTNYLDQIFVAPEHQHKGIGKRLLAFTREHLPDEILLRTAVGNHRAIAWYEREGFVRENEVFEPGWSGPRVYYRWKRQS
ncbi:MAG TPA: GNAT family N-acetyltransferase [Rhizomicrobium sp.]|jgi:ribosomal protein S18 acetylase RimI-like enzyme|nr:GNAT family N-acetyltransferase [Rhizomicrobium sp.]